VVNREGAKYAKEFYCKERGKKKDEWKVERGYCAILRLRMPSLEPIFEFVFTDHALTEMVRREIGQDDVRAVLAEPEQTEMVREGRAVYQAKREMNEPSKTFLLRVFVDIDRKPPYVVTVYRTSKIEKYWR